MTTTLAPAPKLRLNDNNGRPAVGGTITTYQAGTVIPIATYTDSTGLVTNTNPIILDFRGECNLWLQPNVAYKLQFADVNGTVIWTVDNIVNSQLLTLYGGVDVGSTNAYVLNFTSNFSAYADGILIYWIPANTNTGASTINVNGLGFVSILNPDGSALQAGEIVANQPAQILYKSGSFQLITPALVYNNSFTCVWTGFSSPPNTSVAYRKTGNLTVITFGGIPSTGVSNAGTLVMTGIPAIIKPGPLSQLVPCLGMIDNAVTLTSAGIALVSASGSIQFFKDATQPAWTPTGNKGFSQFISLMYAN